MNTINLFTKSIMLVAGVILFGCEYKNLVPPVIDHPSHINDLAPPPVGEILKDTSCITSQSALDAQPFANAYLRNIDLKYGQRTEKGDSIVFALINNEEDYEKYVGFAGEARPTIDFSKYSLLGHYLLAFNCVGYRTSTLVYGCDGYVCTVTYWRGDCDQVLASSNLLIVQKPDLSVRFRIKYE